MLVGQFAITIDTLDCEARLQAPLHDGSAPIGGLVEATAQIVAPAPRLEAIEYFLARSLGRAALSEWRHA